MSSGGTEEERKDVSEASRYETEVWYRVADCGTGSVHVDRQSVFCELTMGSYSPGNTGRGDQGRKGQ